MESPAVQFFNENLPNVSVIGDKRGQFEMHWRGNDGKPSVSHPNLNDLHASLLRRMSIAYSDNSAFPCFGGLDLSSKTGISLTLLCGEGVDYGPPILIENATFVIPL